MSDSRDYVAYCEDADDTSSSVGNESTKKYATRTTPTKERPNTGKSRAEKQLQTKLEDSVSSLSPPVSEPTSPVDERQIKSRKKPSSSSSKSTDRSEREREARRREKKLAKEAELARQQAAEAKAARRSQGRTHAPPVVSHHEARRVQTDNPAFYGVSQPAVTGSRPRAQTRPASYYAGQAPRPPIAHMGWHQQNPQGPMPFPVGTYPMFPEAPHSVATSGPYLGPGVETSGYFDSAMGAAQNNDHLRKRFDRPTSAAGFHNNASPSGYPPNDRVEQDRTHRVARRPSHNKKPSEDRTKMPPPDFVPTRPMRTQSAANNNPPFRPPPQPLQRSSSRNQGRNSHQHRRSVNFADEVFDDSEFFNDGLFNDNSPDPSHNQHRGAINRLNRRSGGFDHEFNPSPSKNRDLRSAFGAAAFEQAGTSYDDKYRDAVKYQEVVSGPPAPPLTAEALRKANKARAVESSRSTRSSGSRDESDYRLRSNGTGITRSSSGNKEDYTIEVSGNAVIRVQGAEIECTEGGRISLSSRPVGSRSGSDQASTVYQIEDSRSRVERKALPHRSRAPSQSDSQSRGYASTNYAPYDPSLAPDSNYGSSYF
jgi:hypothetical protein